MLSLNEFSAGELRSARPIALLLPLAEHDEEFLIAGTQEVPVGIFLGGEHLFRHFETSTSDNWTGLVVPNLTIEVDEESAFDARFKRATVGSVVRKGGVLEICVVQERGGRTGFVSVVSGLPLIDGHQAGFNRWQLVLGEGRNKRVIRAMDAEAIASGAR
jgi:hypothetical protein